MARWRSRSTSAGGRSPSVTIINRAAGASSRLAFGKVNFDTSEMLTPAVLVLGVIAYGSRLAAMFLFGRAGRVPQRAHRLGAGHCIIDAEQGGTRVWWPAYGF